MGEVMKKLIELTVLVQVGTIDVEMEFCQKGIRRIDWKTEVAQLDPKEIAYLILYGWEQFQEMSETLAAKDD